MVRNLSLALSFSMLALGACKPDYPLCKSDDHCKEHAEVCVEGQCRECAVDAQCKGGFTCKGAQCVPKAECESDAQCAAGSKCQEGKCRQEVAMVAAKVACKADAECGAGSCVGGLCTDKPPAPVNVAGKIGSGDATPLVCSLQKVHFGFNDFTLDDRAREELAAAAECIKQKRYTKLKIEGHADDRGTEEYNLALGQKRAETVKKFLGDLGVEASGFQTLSWGEEKPLAPGQDEAAYQENRRTELVPAGK